MATLTRRLIQADLENPNTFATDLRVAWGVAPHATHTALMEVKRMSDTPKKDYSVGYRRPPIAHRFKPGVSGNPRGRPPKKAPHGAGAGVTKLDALVLAETEREVEIVIDNETLKLPVAQAILRQEALAALAGDQKAGRALLQDMRQAEVRAAREDELMADTFADYVNGWRKALVRADAARRPRPEPVPHPDEMEFDSNAPALVVFNGPQSERQKARWDAMLARREDLLEEIASMQEVISETGDPLGALTSTVRRYEQLAGIIIGLLPSQDIRRSQGFDLEAWRARSGARKRIAELRTTLAEAII